MPDDAGRQFHCPSGVQGPESLPAREDDGVELAVGAGAGRFVEVEKVDDADADAVVDVGADVDAVAGVEPDPDPDGVDFGAFVDVELFSLLQSGVGRVRLMSDGCDDAGGEDDWA